MNSEKVYDLIKKEKVIVIVRGVDKQQILNIAKAVLAGGVRLMEVTCNTKGAAEMIELLSKEMSSEMVIGAGTVINKDLCKMVLDAGAKYIVAPDTNPEVIKHCVKKDIAVLPGAATATEVLTAVRYGAKMVKIFPAAQLGPDYIKMLRGPIDNVGFVAVGGIRLNNIDDFFQAGCIGIGIGGSVINKELVEKGHWDQAAEIIKKYKEAVCRY